MASVTLHFQGDSWFDVRVQMYEALGLDYPAQPSTAGDFPEYEDGAGPGEPEPNPAPTPTIPNAPRSHKKKSAAAPAPTPDPAPAAPPAPTQEPAKPARNLPSTDVLKAIVTQAVRMAQKKEQGSSPKILELLPEFKARTGLGFVMEATDAHKEALADLIDAAGLAEAVA